MIRSGFVTPGLMLNTASDMAVKRARKRLLRTLKRADFYRSQLSAAESSRLEDYEDRRLEGEMP